MSKYKDINTGQEYDKIPKGKVQPLIVNGQAVTEGAYDRYYEQHPNEFPELVVVPKQKNTYNPWEIPVFSHKRTQSQRLHPKAVDAAGSSLETLGEFVDVNLPGVSKVASPSWWLGNIGQGYVENPFDYNIRNNGVFEFAPLQQYSNEWWVPLANLGVDLGTGYGGARFIKWGTTPRLIGEGASKKVYSAPFSNKVYTVGGDSKYMALQSTLPETNPYTYIGETIDGPVHSSPKLYFTSRGMPGRKLLQKIADIGQYFPSEVIGDPQPALINPMRNSVLTDLEEGWNWKFQQKLLDPEELDISSYFSLLKKGGKLIPKARKFQTGGQIRKFKEGGVSDNYVPSEDILNYIMSAEKFQSKEYNDSKGIPTIGYGFNLKMYPKLRKLYPKGMTQKQAEDFFRNTIIPDTLKRLKVLTPNWDKLNQNQRDALLSALYNVGEGNYSIKAPNFQQALRDENWNEVAKQMDWGMNDKKSPGLKIRREYEQNLFLTPVDNQENLADKYSYEDFWNKPLDVPDYFNLYKTENAN